MVRRKGHLPPEEAESEESDGAKRGRMETVWTGRNKENAVPLFPSPLLPYSQSKTNGEISSFQALLEKVGVAFPDKLSRNAHFELLKDRAIIARDLIKELQSLSRTVSTSVSQDEREKQERSEAKQQKDLEVKRGNFVDGFKQFVEDPENLKLCLNPTEKKLVASQIQQETDEDSKGMPEMEVQDSVCRLLLQIDPIQSQVAHILFNRLRHITSGNVNFVNPEEIINQFRYLEFVKDSHAMAEHLFDALELAQGPVKEQLVLCIPELILDPETQKKAVEALVQSHMETTRMIGVCLQAMTNLAVEETVFNEILDKVEGHKEEFQAKEWLPVLEFFFLACQNSPSRARTVITHSRNMLHCEKVLLGGSQEATKKKKRDTDSPEERIMTLLHRTFRFNKALRDGAKAVMQNGLNDPDDGKVIDVIFLLLLHGEAGAGGKRESSLLKLKAQTGFLGERVLAAALRIPVVRKFFFDSVRTVAPEFLRSQVISIAKFSVTLYIVAFQSYTTFEEKFDLLRSLLEHIGHGVETETDYALEVLKSLALTVPEKLEEFGGIISSLSDSLTLLSYSQIKTLLETLALLARVSQDEADSTLDDLNRLVAKCLPSSIVRNKLIGVLAALMLIKTLWTKEDDRTRDEDAEIQRTIQLLISETNDSNYARALLMEELANILPLGCKPQHGAIKILRKEVIDRLESAFFISTEEAAQYVNDFSNPVFDVDVCCKLSNQRSQNGKVLDLIHPANRDPFVSKKSPFLLCPLLKLTHECDAVSSDSARSSFEPIAYPFLMPTLNSKVSENSPDEAKLSFSRSYFHASNWIREAMNFEGKKDSPDLESLLERLSHLCECEKQLTTALEVVDSFDIPVVDFNFDPENLPSTAPSKSTGSRSKKRKPSGDNTVAEPEVLDPEEPGPSRKTEKETCSAGSGQKKKPYTPEQIGLFLHELDLSLFQPLLKAQLHLEEIDPPHGFVSGQHLREPQLAYLLQDLSRKLSHSLTATIAKRLSVWKSKAATMEFRKLDTMRRQDIFDEAVKLLPFLRTHMNRLRELFEDIIAESDGIVDSDRMLNPSVVEAEKCFNLILSILRTLLTRLSGESETDREKQEMEVIVSFLGEECFTEEEVEESADNPFKKMFIYLKKFSEKAPSFATLCALIEVFRALPINSLDPEQQDFIASLADSSLKREWPETNRSAAYNLQLKALIESKIELTHEDGFTELQAFSAGIVKQLTEGHAEEEGTEYTPYKTAEKSSWPAYFSAFLHLNAELAKRIRKRQSLVRRSDRTECIGEWIKAFKLFYTLLAALRDHEELASAAVRARALKLGRQVLEACLSPDAAFFFIVEVYAKEQLQDAITAVSLANKGKRILQNICTEANKEDKKHESLIKLIPETKATNEEFLRRLKSAMIACKLEDSFQIGLLKCRNLKGDAVREEEEVEEEENMEETAEEGGTEDGDNDNVTEAGTEDRSEGDQDESS